MCQFLIKAPFCPYPCHFSTILLTNRDEKIIRDGYSHLSLQFEESVKVTKYSYSYGKLEFLAEIGGYIGLFLGYSAFHISFALNYFIKAAENVVMAHEIYEWISITLCGN